MGLGSLGVCIITFFILCWCWPPSPTTSSVSISTCGVLRLLCCPSHIVSHPSGHPLYHFRGSNHLQCLLAQPLFPYGLLGLYLDIVCSFCQHTHAFCSCSCSLCIWHLLHQFCTPDHAHQVLMCPTHPADPLMLLYINFAYLFWQSGHLDHLYGVPWHSVHCIVSPLCVLECTARPKLT